MNTANNAAIDHGNTSANAALQSQISKSESTAQRAKEVLQSKAGKDQQDQTSQDNRGRLNELYEQQDVVNARGQLALTGNNSYSGGTTLSAGTLGGVSGSTLTLSGTSTYGGTTVTAGTIIPERQLPGTQNDADFNGNWLTRNNLNNDVTMAQPLGQGNVSGAISQTTNLSSPSTMQSLAVSGGQVPITRQGTGTVTLSAANTYGGSTVINGGTVVNGTANPNFTNGRIILNNGQGSLVGH